MADPNPGTVHVMEEEMKKAGTGVFEPRSARRKKSAGAAPENKADPFDHDGDGKPGGAPRGGNRKKEAK